jgi:hypothetical protein
MKKLAYFAFIVLVTWVLASCTKPNSSTAESSEKIEPGDQIGDFLITKGEEGKVTYWYDLDCGNEADKENMSCKSTTGKQVNVTTGIYDDTHSGKLDEKWSGFTYELFIEDRPVDLQAFGTVEITHPVVGVIRYWNVVINAGKPGEITVRESGVVDGDPFKTTTTLTFSEP